MNILIIDDDEIALEALRQHADRRGDQVRAARDIRSGIDALRSHAADLIITTASEVDDVRAASAEIPILLVSHRTDSDAAVYAAASGALALLQKPLRDEALGVALDRAQTAVDHRRRQRAYTEPLERKANTQSLPPGLEDAVDANALCQLPFPICIIDRRLIIHAANAAFYGALSQRDSRPDGHALDALLEQVGVDPQPFFQFVEALAHDGNSPGRAVCVRPSSDPTDIRHYYVTAFSAGKANDEQQSDLTCLLLQDQTLQVQLLRDQLLRDGSSQRALTFRSETGSFVNAPDPLTEMAPKLVECLSYFNPVGVRITAGERQSSCGHIPADATPYITAPLQLGEVGQGRLELFSSQMPEHVAIQREFVDKLADAVARSIDAHAQQFKLLQTSHLHALGEMAAGVAHELNQPLSGIRTFAETILLSMRYGWEVKMEDVRSTLEDIVGQVDRMSNIINHMRDFSRNKTSEEEAVSFTMGEVIDNVFKLAETQLNGHGIRIEKKVEEPLPTCLGWPQQLEQVLLNLITNARQAMDERITLRAHDSSIDAQWEPVLAVEALRRDRSLLLRVSDTGGGIPERIVKHIFDPFFTSKQVGQGTGLGLSISYGIVRKHGGEIRVENRPGIGATFCVSLPIHQEGNR